MSIVIQTNLNWTAREQENEHKKLLRDMKLIRDKANMKERE